MYKIIAAFVFAASTANAKTVNGSKDGATTCKVRPCNADQYLNTLACKCFNLEQCNKTCENGEETMSLVDFCKCVPRNEIRNLFPDSASREQVADSIK